MSRGRCRAKNPSACRSPRCPQRGAMNRAYSNAISKGLFNDQIPAQEQEKRLEPVYLEKAYIASEWDRVHVKDTKTGDILSRAVLPQGVPPYSKDISVIQDYESFEEIDKDYHKEKGVVLRLTNSQSRTWTGDTENILPGYSISDLYVSPALRGQGAGTHIMRTLTAHADKTDQILEVIPTESGDGRLRQGEPGWREAAIEHQARLTAFYQRHGFVKNPFFINANRKDFLTGERIIPDYDAQSWYTEKAEKYLRNHSMYIRYPNGKMPKGWMRKTPRKIDRWEEEGWTYGE